MIMSFVLSVLSIFSVYGMICFVTSFIIKKHSSYYIITTLNDEENIECILRLSLFFHPYDKFIVYDIGSSDKTIEIVKKLAKNNSRIVLAK